MHNTLSRGLVLVLALCVVAEQPSQAIAEAISSRGFYPSARSIFPAEALSLPIAEAIQPLHQQARVRVAEAELASERESAPGPLFRILGHNSITYLLTGSFIRYVGWGILQVVLPTLIWQSTHSASWVGYAASAQWLPMFLSSPLMRQLKSRLTPTHLMLLQWARASMTVGILAAYIMGVATPHLILGVSLLGGLTDAISSPLYQLVMRSLVEAHHSDSSVRLNFIGTNVGNTLGPLVGGVLLLSFGIAPGLIAAAAAYGLFGVAIGFAKRAQSPLQRVDRPSESDRGVHGYWPVFALVGLMNISVAAALTLQTIFVTDVYRASDFWLGIVRAAFSLGGAVSPLVFKSLKLKYIFTGIALASVAVCSLAFNLHLGGMMIALFAANLFFTSIGISVSQHFLSEAPEGSRPMLFAMYSSVGMGSQSVGSLLVGSMSERFGPRLTVGMVGFMTFAVVAGFQRLLHDLPGDARIPSMRRLRAGA